VTAYQTSIVLK